jgi:hypothetical protein
MTSADAQSPHQKPAGRGDGSSKEERTAAGRRSKQKQKAEVGFGGWRLVRTVEIPDHDYKAVQHRRA